MRSLNGTTWYLECWNTVEMPTDNALPWKLTSLVACRLLGLLENTRRESRVFALTEHAIDVCGCRSLKVDVVHAHNVRKERVRPKYGALKKKRRPGDTRA